MPATYTLIASETLTSTSASVTFSSIPNTYTDLVLRFSARSADGGTTTTDEINVTFNDNTGTVYSQTYLAWFGTNSSSSRASNQALFYSSYSSNGSASTSNTFTSVEFYIPNYISTDNKPFSTINITERNNATAYAMVNAALFRSTSTISSIQMSITGISFATSSSFFLYGILKA